MLRSHRITSSGLSCAITVFQHRCPISERSGNERTSLMAYLWTIGRTTSNRCERCKRTVFQKSRQACEICRLHDMFDRRFQIFISSTFRDLADERQTVLMAIQRLNHIPAGMELFPSANEAPWDVIERIIGKSDYYVLIVGGRYGSMDGDGISFTEREYDLAISLQIPVLAFLHAEPEKLTVERSDIDSAQRAKLKSFREKVQKKAPLHLLAKCRRSCWKSRHWSSE